jgi:hypothetical protein
MTMSLKKRNTQVSLKLSNTPADCGLRLVQFMGGPSEVLMSECRLEGNKCRKGGVALDRIQTSANQMPGDKERLPRAI